MGYTGGSAGSYVARLNVASADMRFSEAVNLSDIRYEVCITCLQTMLPCNLSQK